MIFLSAYSILGARRSISIACAHDYIILLSNLSVSRIIRVMLIKTCILPEVALEMRNNSKKNFKKIKKYTTSYLVP